MFGLFKNKKDFVFLFLGFTWMIYSVIIIGSGNCYNWIEEYEDGWYIMASVEEDGQSYSDWIDGPFSEDEAIQEIDFMRDEAQKFKRTYGTVFNFLPTRYPNVYTGSGSSLSENLKHLLFVRFPEGVLSIGPLYILYFLYNRSENKNYS